MNCFESRRALLAEPRRRSRELDAHLASCDACGRMAAGVERLDRDIAEAAWVRPPEALAERILLARRRTPLKQYAVAAALVIGSAIAVIVATQVTDISLSTHAVEAVGPAHPAVAAISEVAEDAARPVMSETEASQEVEQVLKHLGLALKKGEATTYYVGKCYVTAGGCDHIVLTTPDAQANVMLVSDYAFGSRVIVTDRRMIALVNPTGPGGYIVVADTPKNARRIEKLLVKG